MRKTDTGRPRPMDIAIAFVLLSRLPLPRLPAQAFDHQARAGWAFPLVGLAVALVAGGLGWGSIRLGMPAAVAAGVVLAVQIMLTGAMHEDGLADTADGLWGGWTPERRLEIMKDSAIGTYGVLALILSVGLRWVAIAALIPAGIGAVCAAACLSRAMLPAMMTALPPARGTGLAHKVGAPSWTISVTALALGLIMALLACGVTAVPAAIVAALTCAGLGRCAQSRIGGQTGDILGAGQQLTELAVLLTLLTLGT